MMIDKTHLEKIQEHLKDIELQHEIRILHAIESGSRAWGFPSPDSDYDVRFIYVQKTECYLSLDNEKEQLEYYPDSEMDIIGWDLKKYLKLVYKSNSVTFEWANSPIVYKTTPEWNIVKEKIPLYFNERAGLHHYLGEAAHILHLCEDKNSISYKKYLYILRVILASRYIEKHHNIPPMLFEELIADNLPIDLEASLREVLTCKAQVQENDQNKRFSDLDVFIRDELQRLKAYANSLKCRDKLASKELSKLLYSVIMRR